MIVNISGKQGSGKSTLMRQLQKDLMRVGIRSAHHRFAEVMYEMHDACQEIALSYGLEFPKKHGRLLQVLGTEAFREAIDEDYWVKATRELCSQTLDLGVNVIVIDDCRFPNELTAFDGLCPVMNIRLEASESIRKARAEGWRDNSNHSSETALDGHLDSFDTIYFTANVSVEEISQEILYKIEEYFNIKGVKING